MSADPRDEVLSALYRGATTELPRPEADAAVLHMSREAVANAPSGSTRWGPRLALAATVVLAVGLVTRIQLEAPDLQAPPGPARTAPAASSEVAASAPEAAPKTGSATATDAPNPSVVTQASRQRHAGGDVPSSAQPSRAKLREEPGAPKSKEAGDTAEKKMAPAPEKSEIAAPQQAASGPADAVTEGMSRRDNRPRGESELKKDQLPTTDRLTQTPSESRSAGSGLAGTAAPAATPFPGAPAPSPAVAVAPLPAARPAPAPSAPAARMQSGARELDHRALNDELPEAMLTPEQWAARIAAMRKSGRHAEADASLKRLTEKFPGFKVPPEARSPDIE